MSIYEILDYIYLFFRERAIETKGAVSLHFRLLLDVTF